LFGRSSVAGQPMLAAGPLDAPSVQSTLATSGSGGSIQSIRVVPGGTATVGPIAGKAQPGQSAVTGSRDLDRAPGNDDSARPSSGPSMLPPPLGGRQPAASDRTRPRPGGRAAVWYSQRQHKRDSSNPWAVRRGIPPVIEPPPEPPDHDPGPGVIGIDA
jgi:hypothetical protein